jgi:formate dehydrogenase iron-sulfur subunit
MTKIYVPLDSAALSMGANEVAQAISVQAAKAGLDVTVVRTGSRGMLWLEPLVEVETDAGRVGYANVSADQIPELIAAGFLSGSSHDSCLGLVEELDFIKEQTRITFARVGVIDPLSLADYESHGGLKGLRNAISMSPEKIVTEVTESGLRGRGGAGFPAGIKWNTVLNTE